jgi:hypothetical protein
MKTIRELLLDRRATAEPQLDALREQLVRQLATSEPGPFEAPASALPDSWARTEPGQSDPSAAAPVGIAGEVLICQEPLTASGGAVGASRALTWGMVWHELFWSARGAWLRLSVGAMAALALQLAVPRGAAPAEHPPASMMVVRELHRERARLLAELLDTAITPPPRLPASEHQPPAGRHRSAYPVPVTHGWLT